MIFPFYSPFSRFPYNYNPRMGNPNFPKALPENNIKNASNQNDHVAYKKDSQKESQKESRSATSDDDCFFEIFGLKLYFDDILLICLLFFLYQEGVKDEELFISLILLLLS